MAELKNRISCFFRKKQNTVRIITFLLVFLLNLLTVKTSDDLGYSINNGLFDIFAREYTQYMTWTGRSVAHIIARMFLAMPKGIFNLFNSLIFCTQIELIGKHAVGPKKEVSSLLYGLIALLVFLFVPVFGQTVLWETGSCNYLWTTTIILAFLYQYRKELYESSTQKSYYSILMLVFGVIAGWTNENTGGACILMVLCLITLYFKSHKSVKPWMITGLLGSVIGFILMIKAPGNAIRSADFINEGGKAYVLIHDLMNALDVFSKINGQIVLWVLFAVSLSAAILIGTKTQILLGICYAASGMAAVLAIILSPVPVYFDRSMYGATILLITGIAVVLGPLLEEKPVRTSAILVTSILLVFTTLTYARTVVDLGYTRYQYQNREHWVAEQKSEGNRNPVVPQINSEFFTTYNAMYGLNDILDYPSFVNNENYAITHGLESVISTTPDKWNNLYRNGNSKLMNVLDLEEYLNAVKEEPNLTALITCSTLNERYEAYLDLLADYFNDTDLKNAKQFILLSGDKATVKDEPFGMEANLDGHYVWISSSEDPTLSDILIDGIEYTNDIEGISIVVFDKTEGRPVDSVTWNTDYGMRGLRYYLEQ